MDKNYAYISIFGKDDISLVSAALNLEPTKSWNVGDKRRKGSIYDFSHWKYKLPEFEQACMDEALEKVVAFIEKKQIVLLNYLKVLRLLFLVQVGMKKKA